MDGRLNGPNDPLAAGLPCVADLARSVLRRPIQHRANLRDQRRARGMLPPVAEVEAIVEVGRVSSLSVLKDRLQLVQRLRQPRLGRLRCLVFIPETQNLRAQRRREGLEEPNEITPLVGGLPGGLAGVATACLLGRRNVPSN